MERLHQCAEKELQQFLNAGGPMEEFNDFRTKLAGLTRYLCSYVYKSCSKKFPLQMYFLKFTIEMAIIVVLYIVWVLEIWFVS